MPRQVTMTRVMGTDYLHYLMRVMVSEYVRGKKKKVYAIIPESFVFDTVWLEDLVRRLHQELDNRIGV